MDELTLTGAQFRDMFASGAALLEKNRAAIDALNVFPVPDGDTGANMCMTMQSAMRELQKIPADANVSKVADTISMGALRGARGNSGVILSQLLRGFSKALKGATVMDSRLFSEALKTGTEAAYKAVMRPKEGTILTVSRMISEAVAEEYEKGANVYKLLDTACAEGARALAKTPDLLPVLKEAGVVDSGGKGLLTIYRGFKMYLDGVEVSDYEEEPEEPAMADDAEVAENITYGYCTEFFIIHLNPSFREEDLVSFREHLNRIGDSVVAAYDEDTIKVHVHSDAPGKVLQMALRFGELDRLKIENMREQNRALVADRKSKEKEYAMIAVSAGAGIDELFSELGVDHVIPGGQTMNPSIESISKAIYQVNARNVFILPNNSNIIMAAEQAANIAKCNAVVIPSKSIPQGIIAAMNFNTAASVEDNRETMTEALGQIVSGSVTYAVRNTKFHGRDIAKGDIIGMLDGDLCVVGQSVQDSSMELVDKMVEKMGFNDCTITLLYGADVSPEEADRFLSAVQEKYPDAECIMQNGGQSLYYYYMFTD
ncbi:MAG: DAK2 domain-containing protein [Clostridia bacterium]|nr:DAK2 domain-containing protein [Clostridia bacterium]